MSNIYKYPRTMHLPWSDKLQNDDRRIESLDSFEGEDVVVTEKMDGENTSLYRDYIHARSPSPIAPHPSRTRIKQLHERIRRDIPDGWRICGENMYARHSIQYKDLEGFFLVFSIWNGSTCLGWEETVEWAKLLDLCHVPVLYRGIWDEQCIKSLYNPETMWQTSEGYVVRVAGAFQYQAFEKVVAKYVRANHVQTDSHWMFKPVVPNQTKDNIYY